MSDCENYKLAEIGERSFVVFSVDKGRDIAADYANRGKLENMLSGAFVPFARAEGVYKGAAEMSYVIEADEYSATLDAFLRACGQESILVLGPKPSRDGYRPATLHFLAPLTLPVSLGYFVPCEQEHAETCDASTLWDGQYFVATHDPDEVLTDEEREALGE